MRPLDPCGTCPACAAGHSHICQSLKFIGIDTPGALQGLWTVPAHTLHRLPDSLTLRTGCLGGTDRRCLPRCPHGRGDRGDFVVVMGGGPIGMLIALVARAAGRGC